MEVPSVSEKLMGDMVRGSKADKRFGDAGMLLVDLCLMLDQLVRRMARAVMLLVIGVELGFSVEAARESRTLRA